jgi:hypothetical protein
MFAFIDIGTDAWQLNTVRFEQKLKALLPKDFKLPGNVTVCNPVQLANALEPMQCIDDGTVKSTIALQSLKTSFPIDVTEGEMNTLVSNGQAWKSRLGN